MDILERIFPRVISLEKLISDFLSPPSLSLDCLEEDYKTFLATTLVGIPACHASYPGPRDLRQYSEQAEVVDRVMFRLKRQGKEGKNVLLKGCHHWGLGRGCSNLPCPLIPADANSTQLLTRSWSQLLSKIGDELMMHILENLSIFVAAPPSCFIQLTGPPVSSCIAEIMLLEGKAIPTSSTENKRNEQGNTKLTEEHQTHEEQNKMRRGVNGCHRGNMNRDIEAYSGLHGNRGEKRKRSDNDEEESRSLPKKTRDVKGHVGEGGRLNSVAMSLDKPGRQADNLPSCHGDTAERGDHRPRPMEEGKSGIDVEEKKGRSRCKRRRRRRTTKGVKGVDCKGQKRAGSADEEERLMVRVQGLDRPYFILDACYSREPGKLWPKRSLLASLTASTRGAQKLAQHIFQKEDKLSARQPHRASAPHHQGPVRAVPAPKTTQPSGLFGMKKNHREGGKETETSHKPRMQPSRTAHRLIQAQHHLKSFLSRHRRINMTALLNHHCRIEVKQEVMSSRQKAVKAQQRFVINSNKKHKSKLKNKVTSGLDISKKVASGSKKLEELKEECEASGFAPYVFIRRRPQQDLQLGQPSGSSLLKPVNSARIDKKRSNEEIHVIRSQSRSFDSLGVRHLRTQTSSMSDPRTGCRKQAGKRCDDRDQTLGRGRGDDERTDDTKSPALRIMARDALTVSTTAPCPLAKDGEGEPVGKMQASRSVDTKCSRNSDNHEENSVGQKQLTEGVSHSTACEQSTSTKSKVELQAKLNPSKSNIPSTRRVSFSSSHFEHTVSSKGSWKGSKDSLLANPILENRAHLGTRGASSESKAPFRLLARQGKREKSMLSSLLRSANLAASTLQSSSSKRADLSIPKRVRTLTKAISQGSELPVRGTSGSKKISTSQGGCSESDIEGAHRQLKIVDVDQTTARPSVLAKNVAELRKPETDSKAVVAKDFNQQTQELSSVTFKSDGESSIIGPPPRGPSMPTASRECRSSTGKVSPSLPDPPRLPEPAILGTASHSERDGECQQQMEVKVSASEQGSARFSDRESHQKPKKNTPCPKSASAVSSMSPDPTGKKRRRMNKKRRVGRGEVAWLPDDAAALIKMAADPRQVYLFLRHVLLSAVPEELWGSVHNRNVFLKGVKQFVRLGRFERITLHQILADIKAQDCSWSQLDKFRGAATPPFTARVKQRQLVADFFHWLVSGYVIPLILMCFYVTETSTSRNQLVFYRKPVWSKLERLGIKDYVSSGTFTPIKQADAEKFVADGEALGFSRLRFVPKTRSLRPITKMGRSLLPDKRGLSIRLLLQDLFDVLKYYKSSQPSLLGSSILGMDSIYDKMVAFVRDRKARNDSRPLYFVKLDIEKCFDSIRHNKLYQIVSLLLRGQDKPRKYLAYRYTIVASTATGKLHGTALNHVTVVTDAREGFHCQLLRLAQCGKIKKAVIINKVFAVELTPKSLLQRLKQHVQGSIMKIGGRYYRRREGISQGSILSSLLCSFFYAHLERCYLSDVDRDGLLMRMIDDFLLITPHRDQAERFLRVLLAGVKQYGCAANPSKTLTNFEFEIDGQGVPMMPAAGFFPWCGLLFNTQTLSVSNDYTKYNGVSIRYTLTMVTNGEAPLRTMRTKLIQSLKAKSIDIFLDPEINSFSAIVGNVHHLLLLLAYRFHSCYRCLPGTVRAGAAPRQLFGVVMACLRSFHSLAVAKLPSREKHAETTFPLTANTVTWIGLRAFDAKLSGHRATYKPLISLIRRESRRATRKMGTAMHDVLIEMTTPVLPEDFVKMRR